VVNTMRECLRPGDAIGRIGGDEFAVLLAAVVPGEALDTAARLSEALGRRQPCSIGVATYPIDGASLEELIRVADGRLYASRNGRPARSASTVDERLSWAATLAQVVDTRMSADRSHSHAVADWAVEIAATLGWGAPMLGALRLAAMLHDVGMVSVPNEILAKRGALSEHELAVVARHSDAGAELLSRVEGLGMIVPWIRHVHERFDGGGYPDGLAGEAIPHASRILLVADAFDAIISDRPHRPARSTQQAVRELRDGAGTQFDPACVAAMLELLAGLRRSGVPVRLSGGHG